VTARLSLAFALVAATGALFVSGASGVLATVSVGPAAHPVTNGTALWIPTTYRCTHNAFFNLRITIFQADTSALARGKVHVVCSGELQHGAFKAVQGGKPRAFKDGFARACWIAVTQKPPGSTPPGAYDELRSSCNGLTIAPKT
jgi:hypothetical protein